MQRNSVKPSKTRYSPMKLSNSRLKLIKKNSKTRYKPTKLGQTRYKLHKAKGNPAPARLNWVWKKNTVKSGQSRSRERWQLGPALSRREGAGCANGGPRNTPDTSYKPEQATAITEPSLTQQHRRLKTRSTTIPAKLGTKKNKHLNTAKPRKTQ